MRILFYGESPTLETGASRVNRYLLDAMLECGMQIEVIGWSHFFGQEYDRSRYPYDISPCDNWNTAREMILARDGSFDVLFISADMHVPNILIDLVGKYSTIILAAIDGRVIHTDQIKSLMVAAWPVVYSRYAFGQVAMVAPDVRLRCVPLGCEPDTFYPLPYEERRAYREKAFGITDDNFFLVMSANRNQMRKDLGRGMKGFHLFHGKVPYSRLYMHSKTQDVGGNLISQAYLLGLRIHGSTPEIMFTPPEYNELAGFDRAVLNKMYNAADVIISTAQGEGWGLTTTEAMAAGTSFIGPANTSFFEIIGEKEQRGYLAASGTDDLWSIYYGTDDAPRPLTSVIDLAAKLEYVYYHRDEARDKAYAARIWSEQHTWNDFKAEWRDLLWRVRSSLA